MLESLDNYKEKGQFDFNSSDRLSKVCNAPRRDSGIYIIYTDEIREKNLIYIGISGREGKNGEIVNRKDGLGGRIVKGKQFGVGRQRSWPRKMEEDDITILIIKWYVTYGLYDQEFPRPLERALLQDFLSKYGKLPLWNQEL
jgi:hypothetical protein